MRFRLAPTKAEAVDARGGRPTIPHSVIGVSRLTGFQASFALFHELPCGGRRCDWCCGIDDKLKPLHDEALGSGTDAMGRMLHSVPEIIERPSIHGRPIKVSRPGHDSLVVVRGPIVPPAQFAECEIVEERGAVHHVGEDLAVTDKPARRQSAASPVQPTKPPRAAKIVDAEGA